MRGLGTVSGNATGVWENATRGAGRGVGVSSRYTGRNENFVPVASESCGDLETDECITASCRG